MEPDVNLESLILGALIFLSAFFTGCEAAFLSIAEVDRVDLTKSSSRRAQRLKKLWDNLPVLTVSLKVAVMIVNILLVCVAFYVIGEHAAQLQLGVIATFVAVVVLASMTFFVINELWAKVIVLKHNRSFVEMVSLPIFLYLRLAWPAATVLTKLLTFMMSKFDIANRANYLEHHRMMAMVATSEEVDGLQATERAMIDSIASFGETEVHEIMVPRTDMVCVDEKTSLEELIKLVREKGHSRIPLYSEAIDNILGVFHAKDLLTYMSKNEVEGIELRSLAHPAYFVPEGKKVHVLLKEFQRAKYHMAIVVDEYGGTAGLVTLEDVLEEIVGDIQDEHDEERPLYRKLDNNTYIVDAKIDLHELNDKLGLDLPTEGEYESLGGFILSLTGYVPEEKEVVQYDGYDFIVERIERNRIVEVKFRKKVAEPE